MRKINLRPKFKIGWREKLIAVFGILLVGVGLGYKGVKAINGFFSENELQFNKVVSIEVKKPIEIKHREIPQREIVTIIESIPAPEDLETDIEKEVYKVFGIEHYRLALAIFKAESGLREDAVGINTNGTIDVGVAQINTVNFKLEGCSLKEIVNAKENILCAHKIWDRGDGNEGDGKGNFNAWVAFKSGSFIAKLEE